MRAESPALIQMVLQVLKDEREHREKEAKERERLGELESESRTRAHRSL